MGFLSIDSCAIYWCQKYPDVSELIQDIFELLRGGGWPLHCFEYTQNMKNQIIIAFLVITLAACAPAVTSAPPIDMVDAQSTALADALTKVWQTQTALPTATPTPSPLPTSTPTFIMPPPTTLPTTPTKPTVPSPYEAEHEAIRKVIAAYFDKIYAMHNSFQVDGFGDTVSTSTEAAGFLKTELRQQAVGIVWSRINFLRYASYSYTLHYSEIVVFDSGQRARANFTEGNAIVFEISIPYGIVSHTSGIKHIINLRNEQDGWKIIYDVNDDDTDPNSQRSLYAPTPFPKDVLDRLDKQLIDLSQGQGGPALPKEGKSFIPSDPAQLKRWKEYETALAEKLLPQYPRDKVLCEWELTEKSEQKLNVWAVCMTTVTSAATGSYYFPAASVPAVINLNAEGAVQSVEIPEYGEYYFIDFSRLFPNSAQVGFPNVSAMEKHLHWRRGHPTEPPLVVLNATAILTVTPVATPTP
jgi:hypothetical protein